MSEKVIKSLGLKIHRFDFEYPTQVEPSWSKAVSRWYQLDAFAYGLVEGYDRFKKHLCKPSLIILASPEASNETDRAFVETGALSPSKFAHTLPNIRCSPLCQ